MDLRSDSETGQLSLPQTRPNCEPPAIRVNQTAPLNGSVPLTFPRSLDSVGDCVLDFRPGIANLFIDQPNLRHRDPDKKRNVEIRSKYKYK